MLMKLSTQESGVTACALQEAPQAKMLPIKLLRNGEQVAVEFSFE